jgi:3-dehydroquinate synthase
MIEFVERNASALLALEETAVVEAIATAVSIKARIVERDERDEGERALLNYGHTIGHALESLTGYRSFRHGEAVAIGMAAAARIAVECGMLPAAEEARQAGAIRALGLPVRQGSCRPREVLSALRLDKKAARGRVRLVLPRRIGEAALVEDVPAAAVRRGVEAVCE